MSYHPLLFALLLMVFLGLLSGCHGAGETISLTATEAMTVPYRKGLTAQQLTEQCNADLAAAQSELHALETLPAPYTVETLLKPLDQLYVAINNATGLVFLLNNAHPDETLQQAADRCVQEFSKLLTNLGLSTEIYRRLSAVDVSDADEQTQRFLRVQLREFRRAGVDKAPEERAQIRQLMERITDLGQQFSKNIRSDVRSITLTGTSALQGLPDDYIAQHPADENGRITITTDYPDLFPFLRYAENDDARKQLYHAYLNRAYPKNHDTLLAIIEQRDQLATLLGYPDFASYATEIMMVKSPNNVTNFIDRIDRLATARAQRDYQLLLAALQQQHPDITEVGSWQKAYAEELVRKQQYDVDTKVVRQYFQYSNVKNGIFELVEDLFTVEIKPWHTATWHPTVESYAIWENGKVIGRFYLDMHPRPAKYKHAAHFDIQAGIAGQQLPISALVCNFPGGDDPNALMEHRDVETFLHEFGHLLHHIFSGQQRWGYFSGVATERDFVEAPSQMLEEWIWDYDTLSRFAVNQAGEVIPRELVEKMRKARDFGRGLFIRNQMFYAALSLKYYQTPPGQLDLAADMIALQDRYSPFPFMEDTYFYASFGHLYGYSAAYYTYMWSEVIAADILKQFKQHGMRNRELARRYRQSVLAPGGAKDAEQLVADFLGRRFTFEAFISELNQ